MTFHPASRAPRRGRVLVLVGLLIAAITLSLVIDIPSVAAIQKSVAQAGPLGPLLFAAGYAAWTLIPVPRNVASIAAGALFGLGLGSALAWLGAMAGAGLAYSISRWLGRDTVSRLLRGKASDWDSVLESEGFLAIALMRLLPVVPFNAVNYVAGVSAVQPRAYVMHGTAIGVVPGTVAYAALGAYGTTNPTLTGAVLGALVLMSLMGWVIARRR
ncbi:MAG: TVP38/TMEM64 family protein [Marmoricola sp.]